MFSAGHTTLIFFCNLGAHAKFQNPRASPSRRKVRTRQRREKKIPFIGDTTFCLNKFWNYAYDVWGFAPISMTGRELYLSRKKWDWGHSVKIPAFTRFYFLTFNLILECSFTIFTNNPTDLKNGITFFLAKFSPFQAIVSTFR